MENSYRYFENKDCKYYPCHAGETELNCLFCYCPMYNLEHCLGNPEYIQKGDKLIKNCTNCSFPHKYENYEAIINCLKGQQR